MVHFQVQMHQSWGSEWQVRTTSAWEAEAGGQSSTKKLVPYRSSLKTPKDAPKTHIPSSE